MDQAKLSEQLRKQRRKVDFDTFDITVQQLLVMLQEGSIDIAPAYQRKFRWDDQRCSLLIESILLGIPIRDFIRATCRLRKRRIVAECKGLAFVQMYAVYEETIRAVVREALTHIKSSAIPIEQLRGELLGLVLDDELKAVVDAHDTKNKWDRRIKLFLQVGSSSPPAIAETVFPSDGSQFRIKQLETIQAIFGMTRPTVPHPKYRLQIEELVENRNAVSHGRRTAVDVGSGYSSREINKRISGVRRLCLYVIREMERHCSSRRNLCR